MTKKTIIIDLDGTFVSVNTFHKWMKFLFIEELKKLHLISMINILKIVYLRYFKRIDHATMKYMILEISEQNINQMQIDCFVDSLDTYIHTTLSNSVKDKSAITILATAAPLFYAQSIKDKYRFDFVLATPGTDTSVWEENIREIKRKNIISLYQNQHLKQEDSILYTDHHDDIYLMRYVSLTYLVNADSKTIDLVQNENINFKLLT